MSFLAGVFLWGLASLSIPIAIALWNRQRPKREDFGGFFLIRKLQQIEQKRIRLIEIIKLLNRLALLTLVVLFFADPFKKEERLQDADSGFAILIDTGRVMQSNIENTSLAEMAIQKAQSILEKIPSHVQGVILGVSDRCEILSSDSSSLALTRTRESWQKFLKKEKLPFSNSPTQSSGLSLCLGRVQSLFENRAIFQVFISPLPQTLQSEVLKTSKVRIEKLPSLDLSQGVLPLHWDQEVSGEKVRLKFDRVGSQTAELIRKDRREDLGAVQTTMDLIADDQSWLWVKNTEDQTDPWRSQNLIALTPKLSFRVNVWAQKESPGFLSLISALRSHPDIKINRQTGAEPQGDPLIIYGSLPSGLETLTANHLWFFVSPEGATPFKIRDKKQWVSSEKFSDVERAFHIRTPDGRIFIRRYDLFHLDDFETLETFEDGAPSLLKYRATKRNIWVSPFDLEDLTTDLSLEPTYIPYLYRKLDRWLQNPEVDGKLKRSELRPLFLLKGATEPSASILEREDWPGIYMNKTGDSSLLVSPSALPQGFLNPPAADEANLKTREEDVAERERLIPWILFSLFLELLLCLPFTRRFKKRTAERNAIGKAAAVFTVALSAVFSGASVDAAAERKIPIGTLANQMDVDRKTALQQVLDEIERLSNLDFEPPKETSVQNLWKYPVVVISNSKKFGPYSKEDREHFREYLERGGLLFFDDPLATAQSDFYLSAKAEIEAWFPGREMKTLSKESVLFRTYYLLNEVSGRRLASPNLEGLEFDKRVVAVFSSNDLLGSQWRGASGDYALSVSPYGISQRMLARRLLLNIIMYSVTLDYKDDAIHLPLIRSRRMRE